MTVETWCILRTAAPRTVPLVTALVKRGIEAWTPTVERRRKRAKPNDKLLTVAITPTLVFVPGDYAREMLVLASRIEAGLPSFSVFRWCGRVPLIADRELEPLRAQERRARDDEGKRGRRRFDAGTPVKVMEGPAAGLGGQIVEHDGNYALVAFGGHFRMRVASWLLEKTDLNAFAQQPVPTGIAA